jgi:CRP-like cAMP-binding protein
MSVSVTVINSISFFAMATQAERETVALASALKSVKSGELLSRTGQTQAALGFVISGRLQIREMAVDGRVTRLSVIGRGGIIGWLSLIEDGFMTDEVVTIEDGQLLLCPMRILRGIVANSNHLLSNLLVMAARAIRQSAVERNMLTLPSAFQRICFQINTLSNQLDNSNIDENIKSGLPKQHDLATAANTTRETVSRTLQILARAGVITKTGHRVTVLRRDMLQHLVDNGSESLTNPAQDLTNK